MLSFIIFLIYNTINMKDKEIEKLIKKEMKRQNSVINLIASENYVSDDVLITLGSELTNKYAEGYPGRRYYGGNSVVDDIENLCKERALDAFSLNGKKWSVNVQSFSGSPANLAVYNAFLNPGDKIMGMNLSDGGHLSHGHKVSITGKLYKQVSYGVGEDELIDYENLLKIAKKEKPQIIIAGFTAYPRKINWKKFREIADSCGAILLADISHISGLIVGGVYTSPFKYADVVTTTTHKTLRGPRSALIFSKKELGDLIDKSVFPGLQGGPHINTIAAVAVALKESKNSSFKKYTERVVENAKVLSDELKKLGWRIISGGTDSHLVLIDTISNGLSGKEASLKLEKKGIIVNMNTIPGDKRSPFDPSGIRIGTSAETTRGKNKKDFIKIANIIDKILRS
jgi:glycine hydroxymethyltransferase